jgi:hypothetical protein
MSSGSEFSSRRQIASTAVHHGRLQFHGSFTLMCIKSPNHRICYVTYGTLFNIKFPLTAHSFFYIRVQCFWRQPFPSFSGEQRSGNVQPKIDTDFTRIWFQDPSIPGRSNSLRGRRTETFLILLPRTMCPTPLDTLVRGHCLSVLGITLGATLSD